MPGVIRHQQRHVHQTIYQHVRAALGLAGWMGGTPPFNAVPVTMLDIQPIEGGVVPALNCVAVTMGEERPFMDLEMGAGLTGGSIDFYCDVFGQDLSTAVAICDDIRDAMDVIIPLRDYTHLVTGVPVDALIEFEEVGVDVPPTAGQVDQRTWRVVAGVAVCEFIPREVDLVTGYTQGYTEPYH